MPGHIVGGGYETEQTLHGLRPWGFLSIREPVNKDEALSWLGGKMTLILYELVKKQQKRKPDLAELQGTTDNWFCFPPSRSFDVFLWNLYIKEIKT